MGLKVLIVDDSYIMRKVLQRSVSTSSSLDIDSFVEASDGAEAMDKMASDGPFSLIFSDVRMPNIGGIEFLRRLRASPYRGIPVIMVTGEGGERAVMEAIQHGAKGFVMKPFTAAQVDAAIRNVL